MSDYVIETKQLTKVYGDQTAVNAVNLLSFPIFKIQLLQNLLF